MSAFDTARELRMPGVVIERVVIDFGIVGTRMKNMVKKMLRQGYTEGGWSSQSKQLAQKLAEQYELMLVERSSRGFTVPLRSTYSAEVAEKVIELIDADEALILMDSPDHNNNYRAYIKGRYNGARARIRGDVTPYGRWVPMHNPELSAQCCALFELSRTPAIREAAEKVCDMLDRSERVEVTINV